MGAFSGIFFGRYPPCRADDFQKAGNRLPDRRHISREPELLSAYEPVSMALYDADGEEMKIPVLPDDLEPEYML